MLHHPDNDHWAEWREAVKRTGYNMALANASRFLQEIESFTPQAFEDYTASLYRNSNPILCHCFASTNIADEVNYGTGDLDFNGFWEFPCTHREHAETV